MSDQSTITQEEIAEAARANHAGKLFAARFVFFESFAFDTAESLSTDYDGGLWKFYALSNGGFYMMPASPQLFHVVCDNGYEGEMSAEAFGITTCLYAYSNLSFSPDEKFSDICGNHFHQLRGFALQHAESAAIFRAID